MYTDLLNKCASLLEWEAGKMFTEAANAASQHQITDANYAAAEAAVLLQYLEELDKLRRELEYGQLEKAAKEASKQEASKESEDEDDFWF
jgi:hypothetical protein